LETAVATVEVGRCVPTLDLDTVKALEEEKEKDDASVAPPGWSEGEDKDTAEELHDDYDDLGATAGSALAALGAGTTVIARISADSVV